MSYTQRYMMKPQGSKVPLVPIPKLKQHAAVFAPISSKKVEKKKNEVKTKKVASVNFLSVLFFMLLFGRFVPLLKVRYGGMKEPFMNGDSCESVFEKYHGRVLTINGPMNGIGYFRKYDEIDHSSLCGRGGGGGQGESNKQNTNKALDVFVCVGLASDPLVDSFYVPRNGTLVKIEGNFIIQFVLASEKSHGISWKCS